MSDALWEGAEWYSGADATQNKDVMVSPNKIKKTVNGYTIHELKYLRVNRQFKTNYEEIENKMSGRFLLSSLGSL